MIFTGETKQLSIKKHCKEILTCIVVYYNVFIKQLLILNYSIHFFNSQIFYEK